MMHDVRTKSVHPIYICWIDAFGFRPDLATFNAFASDNGKTYGGSAL